MCLSEWSATSAIPIYNFEALTISFIVTVRRHNALEVGHPHCLLYVVLRLTPSSFPISLLVWKIAPALVTGNCVIVKPSPFAPLCAMKLVELAQQVLPPGVLSVLSGDDEL